jgi:hypothetical protein
LGSTAGAGTIASDKRPTNPTGAVRFPTERAIVDAGAIIGQVDGARVIVFQDRTWFGDPRMGAFTVYLDGAKAGVAPVHGEIELRIAPGSHTIRVGQSWFRSPPIPLDLASGGSVRLKADIPRDIPLLPRLARFAVKPRRCLVLAESDAVTRPDRVQRSLLAGEIARRGVAAEGLIGTIGLLLVLFGLRVSVALAVVGGTVFLGGMAVGVIRMIQAKRLDKFDS